MSSEIERAGLRWSRPSILIFVLRESARSPSHYIILDPQPLLRQALIDTQQAAIFCLKYILGSGEILDRNKNDPEKACYLRCFAGPTDARVCRDRCRSRCFLPATRQRV